MKENKSKKQVAILMYLLLFTIAGMVVYFTFLKGWWEVRSRIPQPPKGFYTEPPVVTNRTIRPSWKTPYPSFGTTIHEEDK